MCLIARIQSGNIFTREFFSKLLENTDFVVKCPFQKGVYRRKSTEVYTVNDTKLSVPAFITYEKEFMLITTYSTRLSGRVEDIVHIEAAFKLVH